MKITFYADASLRLETPEVSVITDPCTPGGSGFQPIDEAADLVIMSSATTGSTPTPATLAVSPTW